ncbi:MAG: cytochrome b [Thermodesulfobacteriota bacterium]
MRLTDTSESYGAVTIIIHWAAAALLYALFLSGLYMTGLEYSDPWYHRAPDLHKSFGLCFFLLFVIRLLWRAVSRKPEMVPMPKWEKTVATLVHRSFYPLLFLIPVCGYLISTADGRGVEFFGLFTVPPILSGVEGQEDMAGAAHLYIALFTVLLSGLHSLAALKHHFIEKDATLRRMLGLK